MKVILLRDVAKLGKRYSMVVVPDGYALNKLIPEGSVVPATPENIKQVTGRTKQVIASHEAETKAILKTITALRSSPLTITMSANSDGHLYQAVKEIDIVKAATARGLFLTEATLTIAEPLKALGTYNIAVTHGSVRDTITIAVIKK